MLAAKINNEWVDMYPNTRLKYVYNSPAFSDSPIVGDFSYPLSFPLTNVNKNIFGFLQRADINEETKEYPCELYDNNILIISGNFKVSKSDKLKITGNLINSAYHFINLIKTKQPRTLILEELLHRLILQPILQLPLHPDILLIVLPDSLF